MGFLYFTHIAHQLFFFFLAVNTSLELPTNLLATLPPLRLGMPSAFSFFHYSFHDKPLFIWFDRESFSLSLSLSFQWVKPWVFLYLSLWHAKVVLAIYYIFWAKMPSQQSTSQKRPYLDTENRPFLALHQITPFATSLALARYKLVVLWPRCGYLITFYFCLLSFPCCSCCWYLALSHFALASYLPVLIFYGEWHGLIMLAPLLPFFCPFLGLWACCCYFLLDWPVGPDFFFFFLLGFYIPLFSAITY